MARGKSTASPPTSSQIKPPSSSSLQRPPSSSTTPIISSNRPILTTSTSTSKLASKLSSKPLPQPNKSSNIAGSMKKTAPNKPSPSSSSPQTSTTKKKSLKFHELLKQADQVDSEKLKLQVKVRKEPREKQQSLRARRSPSTEAKTRDPKIATSNSRTTQTKRVEQSTAPAKLAGPSQRLASKLNYQPKPQSNPVKQKEGLAKPSAKLLEKRRAKQQYEQYSDGEDLSDFIVDDEEEELAPASGRRNNDDYDREEIWNIFNRGKRRYRDMEDDDLSDMEATGSQVFAEEQRSAARARREDEMEEEALRRHALEKKRRKTSR